MASVQHRPKGNGWKWIAQPPASPATFSDSDQVTRVALAYRMCRQSAQLVTTTECTTGTSLNLVVHGAGGARRIRIRAVVRRATQLAPNTWLLSVAIAAVEQPRREDFEGLVRLHRTQTRYMEALEAHFAHHPALAPPAAA